MIKGCKVCGISDPDTLNYIINHQFHPLFVGFIVNYKKSSRFVEYEKLKKLTNVNKKGINFCAVLVKPNDEILEKIKSLPFDYYQIYDLSNDQIKSIKKKYNKKIIATITVDKKRDVKKFKEYISSADIILFDSVGYEKSISIDKTYLKDLPKDMNFMIAGNLKPHDDFKVLSKKFNFIDISSGVESKKGIKDKEKINQFLCNINKTNNED